MLCAMGINPRRVRELGARAGANIGHALAIGWAPAFFGFIGLTMGAGLTPLVTTNEDAQGTVTLILGGTAGWAAFAVREWWSSVPPEEIESRVRVREAEHELEEALRERREPQPASTEPATTATDPAAPTTIDNPPNATMALPELWSLTHTRLDHYHQTALGQARRSFRNAQVAMILGFLLLVAFVLVAINASTTTGSVVAGSLGAVAAALAGYVSRTFVRSQEAAASHLRAYFDQPLEFARYLAAERVAMQSALSPEQRAEVLTAMVQAMVAGPPAPPTSPPTAAP